MALSGGAASFYRAILVTHAHQTRTEMLKKLCFALLIFVCLVPKIRADQSKDFRAVIAAPTEIQLANTEAFSVIISIARLNYEAELPSKLLLWTETGTLEVNQFIDGKWQTKSGASPLEIDRPQDGGGKIVKIILDDYQEKMPTLRFDVTTSKANYKVLGSAVIQLNRPAKVEFINVPKVIRADGKTTDSITVRVSDSQDDPISNVPLLLRGSGPPDDKGYQQDVTIAAATDKQGRATFVLPASARPGIALLQLTGGGTATTFGYTSQLEIHYQTDVNAREKWLIEDPDWWKNPLKW